MTEKWVGNYVYDEPHPEGTKSIPVPFYVEWTIVDGILTGTCTDDETKMHFDRPSTIQGFIEDEVISFIKRYPCSWNADETGNVILYEREPPIDIHYSGTLVDDHYEGEWEMTIVYKTEDGFPQEYDCIGTWSLYKENDTNTRQ